MHFSTILCWVSLTIALHCCAQTAAAPLAFNISMEGSGEADELEMIPTSARGSLGPSLASPTAGTLDKTQVESFHIGHVVDFLRENLFLILVILSLLVLVIVMVSCASVLSRKHKVSAYYPCSYPSKMYVDQKDKSGGAKVFSEVPEKTSASQQGEPARDSARRLQEDILMITKNLRTPTKGVRVDKESRRVTPKQDDTDKSPKNNEASDEPKEDNVNQSSALSPENDTGKTEAPEEEGLLKEGDTSSGPQSSEGPQETAETQEKETPAVAFIPGEKTAF
ncbi:transmembrane protein 119b [Clupea harengus]|uniref:Transmembrane protein 119b n=1 Tax=Clupea harengus TaxID=7950 RepID=A0A6P3VJL7_CLUHA|nr:transmembrane protein 119b [Clupea harengus]